MDILQEITSFQFILLVLCGFLCLWIFIRSKKHNYKLFPGPRGVPIFGSLPFLGRYPHVELTKYSKKYGGIFSVFLGRTYVVVVTDAAIAKQLLRKSAAAGRPPGLFQMLPSGVGLVEMSGSPWVEQRKYTESEMSKLGFGRSVWEDLVQMEVTDVLKWIAQSKGEPTDISRVLRTSISNNVYTLVLNHKLSIGDAGKSLIGDGIEAFAAIYNPCRLIAHYPKLFKFLADLRLLGVEQELKDLKNMNECIRKEIGELKQDEGHHSYLSGYLNEIKKNEKLNLGNYFNEENLVGNIQGLVIGGTDTTLLSLLWLLLIMASFPSKQKKVHEEIDEVLGRDGSFNWIDRQKLPYCLATIMEGQRWRTVVPLSLVHSANEDIVVNGHDIPKGAYIMTVLWAFHNDPKYWKEPDVFQPERFLSEGGQVIEEPEAYMPFASGRRICLGKTVAMIELFLFFVSIMQKFQVLPESQTEQPNLEGYSGLSFEPKRQNLRFLPR